MSKLQSHLRNTFLAGIFGLLPVVITIVLIIWVDRNTRVLSEAIFGKSLPAVGFLIALALIYLTGLIATSLLGKWILGLLDKLLNRIPLFSHVYEAWKHISLTTDGTEGVFSKVVLVPDETSQFRMVGFTSGRPIDAASKHLCVFVPNSPNPTQGRMLFARAEECKFIDMSAEEAFKLILSTGNYIPPVLSGDALAK